MPRAEELVATSWKRALHGNLQKEGFLEDALAAALEAPGVWERLHAHLKLSNDVPSTLPVVSTQDVVEEGRTDICLRWPSGYRLTLELKIDNQPGKEQVERYQRSGSDVITVARLPGHIDAPESNGHKFFGSFTWSYLRKLDWANAPLEWRQFLRLLDATEVVVKNVDRAELEGIVGSWDTWDTLQEWSQKGMEAVHLVLQNAGLDWVYKEKKRQRVRVDMTHQRLVWWMWPPPWNDDSLAIYAGFFMGRNKEGEQDPVLERGLPDLMLAFHIDPNSPRGKLMRKDSALQTAIARWTSRVAFGGERREPRLDGHEWEVLRCRQTARLITEAPDPGVKTVEWMRDRALEWVEDGIVQRITELAKSV